MGSEIDLKPHAYKQSQGYAARERGMPGDVPFAL
jgi:hypothetical protein